MENLINLEKLKSDFKSILTFNNDNIIIDFKEDSRILFKYKSDKEFEGLLDFDEENTLSLEINSEKEDFCEESLIKLRKELIIEFDNLLKDVRNEDLTEDFCNANFKPSTNEKDCIFFNIYYLRIYSTDKNPKVSRDYILTALYLKHLKDVSFHIEDFLFLQKMGCNDFIRSIHCEFYSVPSLLELCTFNENDRLTEESKEILELMYRY